MSFRTHEPHYRSLHFEKWSEKNCLKIGYTLISNQKTGRFIVKQPSTQSNARRKNKHYNYQVVFFFQILFYEFKEGFDRI